MIKSYYVSNFPISKLTHFAEENWVHDSNHIRNQYKYLEAIIEDIDNSICEPILVTKSGEDFLPGPHGVNRLMAIIKCTDRTTFPAILNTDQVPGFLNNAHKIENIKDLQRYFKRNLSDSQVAEVNFTDNGIQINSWAGFQPAQIFKTFRASEETKNRIIELFAVEHIHNGTLNKEGIDQNLIQQWQKAHDRFYNV